LSGRKENHASRSAFEELRPDLVLERSDLSAHGWLGHVKAPCCAPHVSLLGDGHEVADLRKAHEGDRASRAAADQGEAATESYRNGIGPRKHGGGIT
jgi:hypothetical protein